MILRIGIVTRRDVEGVYVTLPDLDFEMEWGPLEAVVTSPNINVYAAGKRVLVGDLGSIKDNFIIIGPILESY